MTLIKKISESNISYAKQDKGFLWFRPYSRFTYFVYLLIEYMPFLKRYFERKVYNNKTYTEYRNKIKMFGIFKFHLGSGLSDRTAYICHLIRLSYMNQQIGIIPPCILHPMYNKNKMLFTSWSKYYDLNHIIIRVENLSDHSITYEKIKVYNYHHFFLRHIWILPFIPLTKYVARSPSIKYIDSIKHNHKKNFGEHKRIKVYIKPSLRIEKIAKKISAKLDERGKGKGYYALLVRKNILKHDKKNRPKQNVITQMDVLLKILKEYAPMDSHLYIMSNESDRDYFNPIRNYYKVYQYYDFPELLELSSDNYFLYAVELRLLALAKKYRSPIVRRHSNIITYRNIGMDYPFLD